MRAVVRQAVRDVRTAPPPPPADPPADPTVAALRRVVDDLAAGSHAIGELMLEVAPACLSDSEAADVLALLCDHIGDSPDDVEHLRTLPAAEKRTTSTLRQEIRRLTKALKAAEDRHPGHRRHCPGHLAARLLRRGRPRRHRLRVPDEYRTETTDFKIVTRDWPDVRNRDSAARPSPVVAGRKYRLRWAMQPQDHVVEKGHRLGVVLTSTDHDYTLRHPPGTRMTVRTGLSSVTLPVAPRPEAEEPAPGPAPDSRTGAGPGGRCMSAVRAGLWRVRTVCRKEEGNS
ncbi:CocE/NonD family hydrolase C-terminal non-catalytic domain-containing protein [Streptomyces sp. A244]|uniref:CocE/NonD family hydrolase C-terminal non-catalytic domain-containing protein n=1 Tax=Streptomyces sp. A244 TaxID=2137016 RepID=UPI002158BE0C|nr:CocE/NonD family hydrolase C-terminal non-catalytic domain-containing protein [Streptomyces sp. A244]